MRFVESNRFLICSVVTYYLSGYLSTLKATPQISINNIVQADKYSRFIKYCVKKQL